MEEGALVGSEVEGLRVVIEDGAAHDVDSSDMAFRTAMARAVRDTMKQAKPKILEPIMSVEVDAFVDRLAESDAAFEKRYREADERGCVLRYVGRLTQDGETRIGLMELPRSHPFANGNLTDNVVQFVTHRYSEKPLIVRGPGAGPAVTAAGVFADLLRLCTFLGANI